MDIKIYDCYKELIGSKLIKRENKYYIDYQDGQAPFLLQPFQTLVDDLYIRFGLFKET